MSVNWDAWQFREADARNTALGASLAQLACTPEEGMEAFQRILAPDPLTQTVVSTGSLHARIAQWIQRESFRDTEQPRRIVSSLPDPRSNSSHTYVAPRTALEQGIAEIWQKVLGIELIGVHDNFLELGGHSLLAVRLFAQIKKAFGRQLPLATLFQAPTVEQLAGILRQEGWSAPWSCLVAIQPGGSKPPFFCIHSSGGHVGLSYYELARHLGSDQPLYGLQALGLDGQRHRSRGLRIWPRITSPKYVPCILRVRTS